MSSSLVDAKPHPLINLHQLILINLEFGVAFYSFYLCYTYS